jgi:Zn-dependent peptidase ImmA (M78 family)
MDARVILYAVLGFILLSCETEEWFIQDEFKATVDLFFEKSKKYGWPLVKENLIVSSCTCIGAKHGISTVRNGQRIVYINQNVVDNMKPMIQKVVWHELGHALLNKQHSSNPDDIMYSALCVTCPITELTIERLFTK